MKTLRISDDIHRKLTPLLGQMMAQSGKTHIQRCRDALVSRSVLLPAKIIRYVDEFIEANKQHCYTTREEFIREVVTKALQKKYSNPKE